MPVLAKVAHLLTTERLADGIRRILAKIAALSDALNAADRQLGDGDTGMTVEQIVTAWHTVDTAGATDIGAALIALGRAASQATGSSLGSVFSIGMGAGGRSVRGQATLDRAGIVTALAAAREAISSRSGAAVGDKTILDSIVRIEQTLASSPDTEDLHAASLQAAEDALMEFRAKESRIGRARMYGAKSVGYDDPGMLAAVLLLRAAG